jgi:membrane protein YdbS with pleckstrin-like domain
VVGSNQFTIRCDRRYLKVRLLTQLGFLTVLAVATLVWRRRIEIGVVAGGLAVFAVITWFVRRTWSFTVGSDHIRTEKLFTKQINLRTPLDQVVGINTYEGVLEALLDVGTIEISTASSQRDHVSIKWPHLHDAHFVASRLEALLKEKR